MRDHDETSDDPTELTAAERRAFAALPREAEPPPELEGRVVAAVRSRGHFETRGRRLLLRFAAALLLLAGGVVAGRLTVEASPSHDHGPRFVLLLYEPPGFAPGPEEGDLVDEYAAWARELRDNGRYVTGSPLGSESRLLGVGGRPGEPVGAPPEPALGGYFVLAAGDLDDAERVARSCPHLAHGGVVEVRPLGAP